MAVEQLEPGGFPSVQRLRLPAQAKLILQEDLAAVAAQLNSRPRKTLGWKTPAQALDEFLAAAA